MLTPTLAYSIAMLGALAVYWEMARPGLYVPGLAGAMLLVWGSYSLSRYPVSAAAVAVILAGLLVLLAEVVWNTRFGSAIVGTFCLWWGSWNLLSGQRLSVAVVTVATLAFVAASFVLARSAREARLAKRRDLGLAD